MHGEITLAILASNCQILTSANETTDNLYKMHEQSTPRFRFVQESTLYVVLFSDDHLGLAPLQRDIFHIQGHTKGAEYSPEFSDVLSANENADIPLPLPGPFFTGQCRRYLESKYPMFAINAEQLVDGTDLDEKWCKQHMFGSTLEVLDR
jgi:hypothetical protein